MTPTRTLSKHQTACKLIQEIDLHNTLRAAGKEITRIDRERLCWLTDDYKNSAAQPYKRIPRQREPLK